MFGTWYISQAHTMIIIHTEIKTRVMSCFFIILFHCFCSYAQVLGTTFAHEFHIPIAIQNVTCFYHETRWSLLRQKIRLSKTNYNNNYKFLPLRYIFFTWHPIIIRPPYNQYLNYICMVRLVR